MVHPVNCDFLVPVSNLMLLGFRQEVGVYFLHNSDVEACVCMWNKYLKSEFFFFLGTLLGQCWILFSFKMLFLKVLLIFLFGPLLLVPKSSYCFSNKYKIALLSPSKLTCRFT